MFFVIVSLTLVFNEQTYSDSSKAKLSDVDVKDWAHCISQHYIKSISLFLHLKIKMCLHSIYKLNLS